MQCQDDAGVRVYYTEDNNFDYTIPHSLEPSPLDEPIEPEPEPDEPENEVSERSNSGQSKYSGDLLNTGSITFNMNKERFLIFRQYCSKT